VKKPLPGFAFPYPNPVSTHRYHFWKFEYLEFLIAPSYPYAVVFNDKLFFMKLSYFCNINMLGNLVISETPRFID